MLPLLLKKLRRICVVPIRAVLCMIPKLALYEILFKYLWWREHTVPSAPNSIGIVSIFFRPRYLCRSISKSLYFVCFSAIFLTILVLIGTDISIRSALFYVLSWMTISGILAGVWLSVIIGRSHIITVLLYSTDLYCTYLYQFLPALNLRSFCVYQCTYLQILSYRSVYFIPANTI